MRCNAEIGRAPLWHQCKRRAKYEAREKVARPGGPVLLYYCEAHKSRALASNRELVKLTIEEG